MSEPWYAKWEAEYIGSGDERKHFEQWCATEYEGVIDTDETSETDLLDIYRDTGSWTDTFLDWAFVMEADERTEDHYENHYNQEGE